MNTAEPYFLVWCPETGYTKHKHQSQSFARIEAERLAREHPGKEFVVLVALSSSKKTDVLTSSFARNQDYCDDIPF